jgi:hypothetical protein
MSDKKFRGSLGGYTTPPDVQGGYDALLHEVCVRLGYCGCIKDGKPLHVDDFIPERGLVTADQFAEWVVLADNMTPSTNPHLKHIREAFVRHMGAEFVDASLLRVV